MLGLIRNIKVLINSPFFTEESVTDYILYRLAKRNVRVEKVSRRREALIGVDFIIEGKIAIQAKKLRNGKYNINYKDQNKVFKKYCEDNNMIGFYLYYNPDCSECITCSEINSSVIKKIKHIDDEIRNIYKERESCVSF